MAKRRRQQGNHIDLGLKQGNFVGTRVQMFTITDGHPGGSCSCREWAAKRWVVELRVLLFMLQYSAAPGRKLLDSDPFKPGLGEGATFSHM